MHSNIKAAIEKSYTLQNWSFEWCVFNNKMMLAGYCKDRYEEICKGLEVKNFIYTSRPISFNKETMTVTTKSGSKYKLLNCVGNFEENINNLIRSIEENHG